MLVIEHNLDVIKTADWIIDLGPEGGDGGGEIVADGTPEEIVKAPRSYTGKFLAPVLAKAGKPRKSGASEARRSDSSVRPEGQAANELNPILCLCPEASLIAGAPSAFRNCVSFSSGSSEDPIPPPRHSVRR